MWQILACHLNELPLCQLSNWQGSKKKPKKPFHCTGLQNKYEANVTIYLKKYSNWPLRQLSLFITLNYKTNMMIRM